MPSRRDLLYPDFLYPANVWYSEFCDSIALDWCALCLGGGLEQLRQLFYQNAVLGIKNALIPVRCVEQGQTRQLP